MTDMKQIVACYKEDTREILVDALNDQILKLKDIKKQSEKSGKEVDVNKLPGIFHYHTGIDGYIKDIKNLRDEIESSPTCSVE